MRMYRYTRATNVHRLEECRGAIVENADSSAKHESNQTELSVEEGD